MRNGLVTSAEAIDIAEAVLVSRFPDAVFAFVAGSIMRGEGTYLSDIDMVVIHRKLEAAQRESFIENDTPIEVFVHDPSTLAWFVDADVSRGRPSMLNMIVEGTIIGQDRQAGIELQQKVAARLSEGPPTLTPAQLVTLRYGITDAIDDLKGQRSMSEKLAIGAMLHPLLVELSLRGRGHWNGTSKWAPRLLELMDANLANEFDQAFSTLFKSGDCEPVLELALDELEPHGGPLFDGHCLKAPPTWRA